MHAHTGYDIVINGNEKEIDAIGDVLLETITDADFDVGATITIDETYDCVFEDDICELAKEMARAAGTASFEMSGVIDTSESAGEYMDFRFEFTNGRLTAAFSDWYLSNCMECIENYEDFCEFVMDCTEEEYKTYCEYEFLYTIETSEGEVYSDHVPLHDAIEITY